VLKGIDLRLLAGEMVGVLGPNGSGKSSLLLAIAGVLPVWSGTVRVAGHEVKEQGGRWRARRMASVPQRTDITFPFRCLSLVLMGRYPYLSRWGGYSQGDMEVAVEVMEQTDTLHLAQRRIGEVSGGESQMVIIARALAQEADLLLLDEATSNLDAARKIQVFDLLREKNRHGTTLLCVMHDLNLAALYCRRLVFLKEGRVVLDGPTEEIFHGENLSQIYETDIRVSGHPVSGDPQAHFVPGGSAPPAR
jgi:iron complex transport system ATP-binding protein